MSQAEELLRQAMSSRLANVETEEHIIISEDRFISVPESLQRIAVQFDHRIETVTFDCPRYWDNQDMSKMKIYINYEREDGLLGMFLAQNVTTDDQNNNLMHFDWNITRNVTGIEGVLEFLVCVKKADKEGNEELHWNTELNHEMYISKGLENDETIQDKYPDIFTQILQRTDEVENISRQTQEEIFNRVAEMETAMSETEANVEAMLNSAKEDISNIANEMEANTGVIRDEMFDRANEIETIMGETQDMVQELNKIATPEAMLEYAYTYYAENPVVALEALEGVYSVASDEIIDSIIDGSYVDEPDVYLDEFNIATNEDIDAIIAGSYVETEDSGSGDTGGGDSGDGDNTGGDSGDMGGDEEVSGGDITDEDLDDIINNIF